MGNRLTTMHYSTMASQDARGDSVRFQAILIERDGAGNIQPNYTKLREAQLPPAAVQVQIQYSSLNYKDALAITGKAPVVRRYPMVPGIDFAGIVVRSDAPDWQPGDPVLLNGWGAGETHWGGLAQRAQVPGDWLLPMPPKLNARQAMLLGTAGYTAMLCILALEDQGIAPDAGEILVTGASGGVGSIAVALLSRLGYAVIAATGRPQHADYLRGLGAKHLLDRASLAAPGKPLEKARWIGAIDTLGSHTLANVCAGTRYGGAVAACGLAQGMDFPATVAPFILRGIRLLGIDSVRAPQALRKRAWERLADLLTPRCIETIGNTIALQAVIPAAARLLAGQVRGRLAVDVNA